MQNLIKLTILSILISINIGCNTCDDNITPIYGETVKIQFINDNSFPIFHSNSDITFERRIGYDSVTSNTLYEEIPYHIANGVISFNIQPSRDYDGFSDGFRIRYNHEDYPHAWHFGMYWEVYSHKCYDEIINAEVGWNTLMYTASSPYGPYVIYFPN